MEYTYCPYCKRPLSTDDFNNATHCPRCGGDLLKWFAKTDLQIQVGLAVLIFIGTGIYVIYNGGIGKAPLDTIKISIAIGLGFLTGGAIIKTIKTQLRKTGIPIGRNAGLLVANAIPMIFWCSPYGLSIIESFLKILHF